MNFASNPAQFVHEIDARTDRVLVLPVEEDELRAASFLDSKLLHAAPGEPPREGEWHAFASLARQSADADPPLRDDARFIFHIGHVGSTLIARLLGEASDTLALREPQILRQLAEIRIAQHRDRSLWPTGRVAERLPLARQWLSRTFREGQRALIKATNFVSELGPELIEGTRKAVFLTLSPERYLQTILAGEGSRAELAALAEARLARLNSRLDGEPITLDDLDEAQRGALAWACEMTALNAATRAARRLGARDNVLWQDFDAFLDTPDEALARTAAHLEIAISQDQAQSWVKGPIMSRYSKAPQQGYSPQMREEMLARTAEERGEEIQAALDWLDEAGKAHPVIARALDRA
ncbi:MAG: hypothetical protein HRT64_10645 [Erythrobacter sp.]|nr:hypothetical protein [Erythrobacter sp.]